MILGKIKRFFLKFIPISFIFTLKLYRNRYFKKGRIASPVYLGNNRLLIRTIFGHKMIVDSRDLSLTPHLALDRCWELNITKTFIKNVKKGMTYVEIGANVGYYTLIASQLVENNGKVIAFEANKEIFYYLFHNIEINGFLDRSIIENKAVFDKDGKEILRVFRDHKGGSTLADVKECVTVKDIVEKELEVETVCLDTYLKSKNIDKVDFIKIDAEGSEPFIFKGMKNILSNNPKIKIICEFNASVIRGLGYDPIKFIEDICSLGFKINIIDSDRETFIKKDDLINIVSKNPISHYEFYLYR